MGRRRGRRDAGKGPAGRAQAARRGGAARASRPARRCALEGSSSSSRGRPTAAIEACEKAAQADPKDLASRWSAARLLSEKPGGRAARDPRDRGGPRAGAGEPLPPPAALGPAPERGRPGRRLRGARPGAPAAEGATTGDGKLERYTAEAKAALDAGDAASARAEDAHRREPASHDRRATSRRGTTSSRASSACRSRTGRRRSRARAPGPAGARFRSASRRGARRGSRRSRASPPSGSPGKDGRDLAFAGNAGIVLARASDALPRGTADSGLRPRRLARGGRRDQLGRARRRRAGRALRRGRRELEEDAAGARRRRRRPRVRLRLRRRPGSLRLVGVRRPPPAQQPRRHLDRRDGRGAPAGNRLARGGRRGLRSRRRSGPRPRPRRRRAGPSRQPPRRPVRRARGEPPDVRRDRRASPRETSTATAGRTSSGRRRAARSSR